MESEMKLSFLIFLITSVFEIIVTMLYFLFGFVRFFFANKNEDISLAWGF